MENNAATYPAELVELATLAKALAHPARLQILEILARDRSCVCGALVEQLPVAQATVSQHLGELKKAGLIQGEISGPRVCYCLDEARLQRAWQVLGELFARVGCCPGGGSTAGTFGPTKPKEIKE